MARSGTWSGTLPGRRTATAWQRPRRTGRHARARTTSLVDRALHARARRRHGRVPSALRARPAARRLGPGARRLPAARVARRSRTRLVRALVRPADRGPARDARSSARSRERAATPVATQRRARAGSRRPSSGASGSRSSAHPTLPGSRATIDLERLRDHPTDVVRARLARERGIGPWSVGVIALEGLGRYDHGLVGDLALVKLHSVARRAAGSRAARRPSCSRRTASGRGSPARS